MSKRQGLGVPLHEQQKINKLKPGMSSKNSTRSTIRAVIQHQPITQPARHDSYDKIRKIENIQKDPTGRPFPMEFQDLYREFRTIIKDDVEMGIMIPDDWKSETGRAMLIDGNFYIAVAKIYMRSSLFERKVYIKTLKEKALSKVTQNKAQLEKFIKDEMQAIARYEKECEQAWKKKEQEKQSTKAKLQITRQAEVFQEIRYPDLSLDADEKNEIKLQKPTKKKDENRNTNSNRQIEKSQHKKSTSKEKPQQQNKQNTNKTLRQIAIQTSPLKQQKPIRKSCLKPPGTQSHGKSVRWSQLQFPQSSYLTQVVAENKQAAQSHQKKQKQRKELLERIHQSQSFLIDFFQINDVYDMPMVEIVGVIEEIDDKYVILTVKEKPATPEPSYVKTRKTYEQQSEFRKEAKEKKEILAIGLLKSVKTHDHDTKKLKEIEMRYPNIFAYVNIENPDSLFLGCLPDDSVDSSQKKERYFD